MALGEILKDIESPEVPETETITYERRKKHRPDDCVTDQGLRFTEGVPVELIHISAPEMQGEDADQYEIIDHKYTHLLFGQLPYFEIPAGCRSSQAQPDPEQSLPDCLIAALLM